jgi:hypothetical protein
MRSTTYFVAAVAASVLLLQAPAVHAVSGAANPDSPGCQSMRDSCVASWNAINFPMNAPDVKVMSCDGQYPFTLPGNPGTSSAGFFWYLELQPPANKGFSDDIRCRLWAADSVSTPTVQTVGNTDNYVGNSPSDACTRGAKRCIAGWNGVAGAGPYMKGPFTVQTCAQAANGNDWTLAVVGQADTPPGTAGPPSPPTITCTMSGAPDGYPSGFKNSLFS